MLGRVLAAAVTAAGIGFLAQPAWSETPALDQLPAAIKPTGMSVYLEVPATGVQIYTCGKDPAGAWTWNFKGPEAELLDTQNKTIGKHYGGPTWEGSDGGKVVGAVKANAPAPGGNAIPWLLLDIKSSEGSGQFTQAKGILRISTTGGTAPAQGCDEAHANQESRVPYTATYLFLK
jgi:Protein of unknown function (DUF3455)